MSSSQLHNTFLIPVTNNGQHIKIVQLKVKMESGEWSMKKKHSWHIVITVTVTVIKNQLVSAKNIAKTGSVLQKTRSKIEKSQCIFQYIVARIESFGEFFKYSVQNIESFSSDFE